MPNIMFCSTNILSFHKHTREKILNTTDTHTYCVLHRKSEGAGAWRINILRYFRTGKNVNQLHNTTHWRHRYTIKSMPTCVNLWNNFPCATIGTANGQMWKDTYQDSENINRKFCSHKSICTFTSHQLIAFEAWETALKIKISFNFSPILIEVPIEILERGEIIRHLHFQIPDLRLNKATVSVGSTGSMDQCKILLEIQILIAKIICKYCCLYLSVPNHQKTQIRSKSKHLKGHITVLDLHNPLNKESVLKHEKQQNPWNTATIYIFKGFCRFSCFQTLSVFRGFCRFSYFYTLLDWCWIGSPPSWAPQTRSKTWDVYP